MKTTLSRTRRVISQLMPAALMLALTAGAVGHVTLAAPVPVAPMAAPVMTIPESTNMVDQINDRFGVVASELAFLDITAQPGEPFTVILPLDGMHVFLDLWPHDIRTDDFRLTVQTDRNTFEAREPAPSRTLRGHLFDIPFTRAAGSLMPDGLYARIMLPDGREYWVQPVHTEFPDAPNDLYIIHASAAGVIDDAYTCGTTDDMRITPRDGRERSLNHMPEEPPMMAGGDFTEFCIAEIACDADVEFHDRYGSVNDTVDRIELVLNSMNPQYENEVGITHEITEIIVRETEEDPYTATDAGDLLNEFRNEWQANQGGVDRDVAHLFTGKDLDGSVVGLAWVGVICTSFNYGLVQSTLSSFARITNLSAHELGHNWDASHCTCPEYTMNPSLTTFNTFNPTETRPDILAHRDSRGCLDCTPLGDATLDSYTIAKGTLRDGTLDSLVDSDNDYLRIDSVTRNAKEMAIVKVDATSPFMSASQIDITLESAVTANGVKTLVHLYNWGRGQWVKIDGFNQSRSDSTGMWTVTERPNRFIDADGSIRIRIKMKSNTAPPYTAKIDLVNLFITP